MALVTVCDRCQKILDDKVDEVKIVYEYNDKDDVRIPMKRSRTFNLCGDCYKEIFGNQLEVLKEGGNIL